MSPTVSHPSAPAMTPFRSIVPEPIVQQPQCLLSIGAPQPRYILGGNAPQAAGSRCYLNNLYHVEVTPGTPFVHLKIRRLDGGKCDQWRHLQQIKSELVGPECEGVELFPSQGREVGAGNEYHLWVHTDPSYRFPFGFGRRFVLEKPVMALQFTTHPVSADSATPQAAVA